MRICLHQPDIAGNVGTILRLAACTGVAVDIVEPCGFAFGDRALRRAGMDYADAVEIRRHADFDAFQRSGTSRLVLLTTTGGTRLDAAQFTPDDILVMGAEGSGVPPHVHDAAELRVRIPMRPGYRSLNVAVAAGIALAEALRQTAGWPGDAGTAMEDES
ncbi:tRNA (cytidine(34)-2'-O)-methyltransferase [Sphingomonas prati]|uniref:tRNA (cytidine(34)-2'-O)-methyltransferase n=1 Tax=Sphingomonas prati TaxID=1843237 RepID=A0A7W9BP56_9SPHN|nr:tRNA (cytidine(34)-2'-O)-methyltransferase [Sphingomonas prati]MBB5727558.1 tRNA (cytidine/uridine-2'-O-)-methyltransferase [Sphingomonas prati]GGE78873.1 tRNA (cytidine(34)-2'-O)-methyltransferase [Sphingomonas prati]